MSVVNNAAFRIYVLVWEWPGRQSLLNLTKNRERVKEDAQTFSLSNRMCANAILVELGATEREP